MTDAAKAAARKAAFARRRAAHAEGHAAAAALAHLAAFLATVPGAPVAGYLPIRTEIDPRPAMAGHDGPVGVPVILGPGRPLAFHLWTPDTALVPGPFGAPVPRDGRPMTPAVVILPLVAFDAAGTRLGYGGGYYDRTLAALRAEAETLAVGLAYAAQEAPGALPREATDIPLDAVITEHGLRRFS